MALMISRIFPHSANSPYTNPFVVGTTTLVGPFRFQTVVRLETCTVTVTETCTRNPHRECTPAVFIAEVKSKLKGKVAQIAGQTPTMQEMQRQIAAMQQQLAAMNNHP